MEQAFFRRPAPSIGPAPDAFLDRPYRKSFFSAVLQLSAEVGICIAPFHPRHRTCVQRAQVNAERIQRQRPKPESHGAWSEPPQLACKYAEHPDVITAKHALASIGGQWNPNREDLIQDGCIALAGKSADAEALRFTIAKHAIIDAMRKERLRERDRIYDSAYAVPGDREPNGTEEEREKRRARPGTAGRDAGLWDAVNALPFKQRTAWNLKHDLGYTDEEIAASMGTSPAYAAQLVGKAKKGLKRLLECRGQK